MSTSVSHFSETDFNIHYTEKPKKKKITKQMLTSVSQQKNNKMDVDFRNTFCEADVDIHNSHKSNISVS